LKIDTFWHLFLLNETTCFFQNDVVPFTIYYIKKKDTPNGVILNGTMHLLLPLDAHRQGKKKIVPLHRLSPRNLKKPNTTQSLFIKKKRCSKWCHFGWHYASSSSSGCAQAKEEEDCSPTSPLSLSLLEI
jgi:hypothetical protein